MNDLLTFKRNAMMLGLCTAYKDKWDKANDKEALMDMATDAKGMDMIADSCSNGWGLSSEYIAKSFSDYINGKWQRRNDGYTSEMYVMHKEDVAIRSTLTLFIDCECDVIVPKGIIAEIYLSGNSNVHIKCDGHCYVIKYGNACVYDSEGGGVVHEKFIDNSEPHINHNYKE